RRAGARPRGVEATARGHHGAPRPPRRRAAAPRVAARAAAPVRPHGPATPRGARRGRAGRARRDGRPRDPRGARARWTDQGTGAITGAEFDAVIRHPDERHPATALLASMVEALPRLYAMSLDDWGVTKADRLGPRSEDPVRPLVQR